MATTTENLGLTLPAGTDRALISDLNENFQALDAFAGQATDDIQQAQETANAAAPQATTYTKTEVDTALAEKLNTSDVDAALSSTSTNPVQNKAVQAPIARLVDAGAKNLLPPKVGGTSASVTFTVQDDGTVVANGTATGGDANYYGSTVPVAGSYHVSGCPSGGNFATGYACYWTGPNVSEIGNGAVFSFTGNVTFRIIIRQGTTVNNLVFKPMICTAENYAISPEFVPYAPSNRQLYEMILALQSGT